MAEMEKSRWLDSITRALEELKKTPDYLLSNAEGTRVPLRARQLCHGKDSKS